MDSAAPRAVGPGLDFVGLHARGINIRSEIETWEEGTKKEEGEGIARSNATLEDNRASSARGTLAIATAGRGLHAEPALP